MSTWIKYSWTFAQGGASRRSDAGAPERDDAGSSRVHARGGEDIAKGLRGRGLALGCGELSPDHGLLERRRRRQHAPDSCRAEHLWAGRQARPPRSRRTQSSRPGLALDRFPGRGLRDFRNGAGALARPLRCWIRRGGRCGWGRKGFCILCPQRPRGANAGGAPAFQSQPRPDAAFSVEGDLQAGVGCCTLA